METTFKMRKTFFCLFLGCLGGSLFFSQKGKDRGIGSLYFSSKEKIGNMSDVFFLNTLSSVKLQEKIGEG